MTLEKIKTPKLEIELFGEKWNCEFKLRNFAVLRERFDIKEHQLLKGLMEGQPKFIAFAIWASTLKFATPFDPADPTKIEKEMPIQPIFELTLQELQQVSDQVVRAMEAFLPKPKGGAAKKSVKTAAMKKTTKKKKSMK